MPSCWPRATAARLVTRLVDAQALRGTASLVLTGGGIGIAVLEQLALAPARDAIDWSRVDIWWGDERFLPSGDPDRNETRARRVLLDHVPIPEEHVHPMGASDGVDGDSPEAAARRYADELREAAEYGDAVPTFDICLLGVGRMPMWLRCSRDGLRCMRPSGLWCRSTAPLNRRRCGSR